MWCRSATLNLLEVNRIVQGAEPGVPAQLPDHPGGEPGADTPGHTRQVHQRHAQDTRGNVPSSQVHLTPLANFASIPKNLNS